MIPTATFTWRQRWTWARVMRLGSRAVLYALLLAFSAVFMVPFVWLALTSLKQEAQMFTWPPQWIPKPFWPRNYVDMFELVPMARYLANTLKVELMAVSGTVITSMLVGYGFARLRAPGLGALFGLCLATVMLPYQVTMIPIFLIFTRLQWVNTLLPLWVPSWFGGGAFNIFLVRQFISSIPREMEEAATVDGASRLTTFVRIVVPNAKPVITVITIFSLQYHWTDIVAPVIYLNSRHNYTLALGVTMLQGALVSRMGPIMAAAVLMVVPMVVAFFFVQRYITEGVVLSGIR